MSKQEIFPEDYELKNENYSTASYAGINNCRRLLHSFWSFAMTEK